jgi:hypothetical protein
MTTFRKYRAALLAGCVALVCTTPVLAQNYSNQPIDPANPEATTPTYAVYPGGPNNHEPSQSYTMPPTLPQTQWQQSSIQPPSGGMTYMHPVQEGNMTYITGGVGDEERNALEAQAQYYNLKITNADKTGHYAADTNVTIQSKNGREMLSANDTGPLLYAKLPPGEYTITATNGDQRRVEKINVSATKSKDVELVWHDQGGEL